MCVWIHIGGLNKHTSSEFSGGAKSYPPRSSIPAERDGGEERSRLCFRSSLGQQEAVSDGPTTRGCALPDAHLASLERFLARQRDAVERLAESGELWELPPTQRISLAPRVHSVKWRRVDELEMELAEERFHFSIFRLFDHKICYCNLGKTNRKKVMLGKIET